MNTKKMKPTLILHMGGPKSGSSAVQKYLFFNRYELYKKQYIYIDRDFGMDQNKCISHNDMLKDIIEMTEKDFIYSFKKLSEKNKSATFMFSSEGLCQMSKTEKFAKKFQLLNEFYDIKIFLYIRNQVEFIYSGWQQWGVPKGLKFEGWLDNALKEDRANWFKIISIWSSYFNTEQFNIKTYHPDNLKNQDIVDDFIAISGVATVKSRNQKIANFSFSDEVVSNIIDYGNKNNMNVKELILTLKKRPLDYLLKLEKQNLFYTKELQKKVRKYYEKNNILLFEKFNLTDNDRKYFFSERIKEHNKISFKNSKSKMFAEFDRIFKNEET